ncbi:MAG: NAD(P)H:quinone oxidoreductase [Gammaproteobacteria bacterium]
MSECTPNSTSPDSTAPTHSNADTPQSSESPHINAHVDAPYVLVLFYSRQGSTEALARAIARGVEETGLLAARLRTVPPVTAQTCERLPEIPESGAPYATEADLTHCSGLALGSPTRFGNMAAPLKHFLDHVSASLWVSGDLVSKPACVFSSSASMHGGQEMTLLSMMIPLLHHGMALIGLPYMEAALNTTLSGGTPYGATHVAGQNRVATLSADETKLAVAQGRRLAAFASRLKDLNHR